MGFGFCAVFAAELLAAEFRGRLLAPARAVLRTHPAPHTPHRAPFGRALPVS